MTFCIFQSHSAIPCRMEALPGSGGWVLSEFHEDSYFWRKMRYSNGSLVAGSRVDRWADVSIWIYGLGVLIFIFVIFVVKSHLYDPIYIYSTIVKFN